MAKKKKPVLMHVIDKAEPGFSLCGKPSPTTDGSVDPKYGCLSCMDELLARIEAEGDVFDSMASRLALISQVVNMNASIRAFINGKPRIADPVEH